MVDIINPLVELFKLYTIVQILSGVFVVGAVYYRPKLFWPMIIISSIVGQSVRFMAYQFYDEYILWCVLFGAFVRIASANCGAAGKTIKNGRRAVYYLWIAFMVVESVIGIFANDDLRIMRWVFFYASFGLLAFMSYNYGHIFEFPSLKKTCKIFL